MLGALTAALVAAACLAGAARAAAWQFTPVAAPLPPVGTADAPYPVSLGQVGDISFWAPNRGLLITGGTEGVGGVVPSGLYAYDGVSWHLLSTVCGGADGRIAWAGPDDFWTISDQRAGQQTGTPSQVLASISLCHFVDGQVVASYAEPLGQATSYQQMDAAACLNADDCWFGGFDTGSATPGAFLLHWDGANLLAGQESEDHSIDDMTDYHGQIDESVRFQASDLWQPGEDPAAPAVLHRISPSGAISDLFTYGTGPGGAQEQLPDDGTGASPDGLEGFSLSTDGGALGAGATQLWGVANPQDAQSAVTPSPLTIIHNDDTGWSQVLPGGSGGTGHSCPQLPAGTEVADANAVPPLSSDLTGTATGAIAALPGTDEAWLSIDDALDGIPELALVNTAGCVVELDQLGTQQPDQSSAPGNTGPVACAAADDCWMATSSGWLYHYTDGTQLPQDTDPSFAGVITVRPADDATVTTFGDVPPTDSSGGSPPPPAPTGPAKTTGTTRRAAALLTRVKFHVLRHRTLVMTFHLSSRAHVQLIAEQKKKVVGRSRNRLLAPGHHTIRLALNPKHWPTHIKVNAKPVARSS
jgi:hypothetical protein